MKSVNLTIADMEKGLGEANTVRFFIDPRVEGIGPVS